MRKIIGTYVLHALVAASALGAGVWLAPAARALYERAFPEPAFVTGDFRVLYGEAGKKVVMFSTSTCPFCQRARALLASEHVDYRDYVVDQSEEARQRFERLDGGAVPLLFVGDRRIVGFSEEVLRDSLAVLRAPDAHAQTAIAPADRQLP